MQVERVVVLKRVAVSDGKRRKQPHALFQRDVGEVDGELGRARRGSALAQLFVRLREVDVRPHRPAKHGGRGQKRPRGAEVACVAAGHTGGQAVPEQVLYGDLAGGADAERPAGIGGRLEQLRPAGIVRGGMLVLDLQAVAHARGGPLLDRHARSNRLLGRFRRTGGVARQRRLRLDIDAAERAGLVHPPPRARPCRQVHRLPGLELQLPGYELGPCARETGRHNVAEPLLRPFLDGDGHVDFRPALDTPGPERDGHAVESRCPVGAGNSAACAIDRRVGQHLAGGERRRLRHVCGWQRVHALKLQLADAERLALAQANRPARRRAFDGERVDRG